MSGRSKREDERGEVWDKRVRDGRAVYRGEKIYEIEVIGYEKKLWKKLRKENWGKRVMEIGSWYERGDDMTLK